jgi:hypothetical protein
VSTREYLCGYSKDHRPIAHLSGAPVAVGRTRAYRPSTHTLRRPTVPSEYSHPATAEPYLILRVLPPCNGRTLSYPPSTPTLQRPNLILSSADRPTASAQIDTDELIVAADPSASPSALADALALAPSAAGGGGGACVRDIRGAFGAVDRRAAAVLLRNVEVAPERSNYTNCWRSAPSRARSR